MRPAGLAVERCGEAVGPSCDRFAIILITKGVRPLFVTGKFFVLSPVYDPTPPGLDPVLVVLPLFAYATFYCDAMLSSFWTVVSRPLPCLDYYYYCWILVV